MRTASVRDFTKSQTTFIQHFKYNTDTILPADTTRTGKTVVLTITPPPAPRGPNTGSRAFIMTLFLP